jgi:hypothetical protein
MTTVSSLETMTDLSRTYGSTNVTIVSAFVFTSGAISSEAIAQERCLHLTLENVERHNSLCNAFPTVTAVARAIATHIDMLEGRSGLSLKCNWFICMGIYNEPSFFTKGEVYLPVISVFMRQHTYI